MNFPAVETENMLSEEVASFAERNLLCQCFQFSTDMSFDVKINNSTREISLTCWWPTKSLQYLVHIFLRLRREDSNRQRSKQRRVTSQ